MMQTPEKKVLATPQDVVILCKQNGISCIIDRGDTKLRKGTAGESQVLRALIRGLKFTVSMLEKVERGEPV